MNSKKVENIKLCHSGLDPESSFFNMFWTPIFTGVTELGLFSKPSHLKYDV